MKKKESSIGAGVKEMKEIKNVKLGVNPTNMVVTVSADVVMDGPEDPDDLYLVMFNVMDDPLRLSVFTIGKLIDIVKANTGFNHKQVLEIMKTHPEKYVQLAVSNVEGLGDVSKENVKIPLDSETNAKKARIVLSSMIENKMYLQKSTYYIGDEIVKKEQEIDTEPLIPQLKMMIEIAKRWDGFDSAQFQKEIEAGTVKF